MNWKILLLSFTTGLMLITCYSQEAKESTAVVTALHEVNVDQLKQRLGVGENIYLLDVRTPAELAEHGLIKGAVNIPIDELEDRLAEVPKDRPVVTYCARGVRASQASELLQQNGHKGVQHGGLIEWKKKGYPVVYPERDVTGEAGI